MEKGFLAIFWTVGKTCFNNTISISGESEGIEWKGESEGIEWKGESEGLEWKGESEGIERKGERFPCNLLDSGQNFLQ